MIEDKVVIITGASSGIGEATAKLLARRGAKVVLGARREDKLKQIVDEIGEDGGEAVYQELDVTKPSDSEAIVEARQGDVRRGRCHLPQCRSDAELASVGAEDRRLGPDGRRERQGRSQRRRIGAAGVHRAKVRAGDRELVGRRAQGVPGWCGVRRDEVVCARLHGGAANGIRDGGHEHPHRDDLPGGDQYRAAGHHQPRRHGCGGEDIYDTYGISPDRIANVVAVAIDQPEDTTINEFTVGPANQPW